MSTKTTVAVSVLQVQSGILVTETWLNSCLQKLSNVQVAGSCFSVVTKKCLLAESRES